jgi:hypothetical protein
VGTVSEQWDTVMNEMDEDEQAPRSLSSRYAMDTVQRRT